LAKAEQLLREDPDFPFEAHSDACSENLKDADLDEGEDLHITDEATPCFD
jgi:hypothetical protein